MQAHCGEGLENDSAGPQVTGEAEKHLENHWEDLFRSDYLKAFLYLFILQKGTVKWNYRIANSLKL